MSLKNRRIGIARFIFFIRLQIGCSRDDRSGISKALYLEGVAAALQFEVQLYGEDLAGENYVSNLRQRMNKIHGKVREDIQLASDRMKGKL